MTVKELIEELEMHDEDAKVRIASQPSWPLEYTVGPVVAAEDGDVFIGEGSQVGYLNGATAEALKDEGW